MMKIVISVSLLISSLIFSVQCDGILYPQDSETRETKDLSGIWNFRVTPKYDQDLGFREKWYQKPLSQTGDVIPMPVPSSYNDITQNKTIKNHIGWVWYDKSLYVPKRWHDDTQRVFLRFGSVHYHAVVWLNGINIVNHTGGHLPFQIEVTKSLKNNVQNRITVAVNNTLTSETLPQGSIQYKRDTTKYPPGYFIQTYNFDFFNYAGIHRPVVLYTTPKVFIDDITIETDILDDKTTGVVRYEIAASESNIKGTVTLTDKRKNVVGYGNGLNGTIVVPNAYFWWPYLTNSTPGYQYTLEVRLNNKKVVIDSYRLKIGIRKISWDNKNFMINNRPFYFRGFGKHEDSDLRGKGLDLPLIVKDFNLIKWVGANSFRTSHYPYAEEIMDRADAEGIVVIDESPAVRLSSFEDELLKTHMQVMKDLHQRDKNRPSVVMWSIGNEPMSDQPSAGPYFKQLVDLMHQLDRTRPSTVVVATDFNTDHATKYMDIICVNRYPGWYDDIGEVDFIQRQLIADYDAWYKKFNKLLLISEYGAETITGLHSDPAVPFTEDYQVEFMKKYFPAFDIMRNKGYFVGELIWNFADFMTQEATNRINGNKKGIFTRQRQPKHSAHVLRERYWNLARLIDGFNTTDYPIDFLPVCHA